MAPLLIDEHNETSFTVTFNGDDRIKTTVTASTVAVEDWIAEVHRVHRRRLHRLLVGLDAEWRPSYSRHQNPLALLQLCVGRRCLIFQLRYADQIPDALADFLSDRRFTFVGVGVAEDADRLAEERDLPVARTVDLRTLAAEKTGKREMKQKGLAGLAMEVMGVEVDKPRAVRMGNWDAEWLSLDQISYACIDAFLSFEIGRRLFDNEFIVARDSDDDDSLVPRYSDDDDSSANY